MSFRLINKEEAALVSKLYARGKTSAAFDPSSTAVSYIHEGNFTTAIVMFNSHLFVGTAKLNPGTDVYRYHIGETIAFGRALRSIQAVPLPDGIPQIRDFRTVQSSNTEAPQTITFNFPGSFPGSW